MASRISAAIELVILAAACAIAPEAASLRAQDNPLSAATSIKFDLRSDAPVAVDSFDPAESRATSRGGALVLDLHISLKLKNTSGDTIRGVTLLLLTQESTPGGKMSVAVPSLNVAPGETFPMHINGRLIRPALPLAMQSANVPLVHVSVDGILFKSYVFYGPDRLNSHRQLLAWEMEADRDRRYFKQVLQSRGPGALAEEMRGSLARQAERPRVDVQLARGRSVSSTGSATDHVSQFAFLQLPDSPVKPVGGWAEIEGNEARAPRIEVQNDSPKHVRYVEIAWLVKDRQGREFLAGSVPASEGELYLPPGKTARLLQETSLRFTRDGGQPVDVQSMTGFVNEVEYSDGKIWIPRREALQLQNRRLLNVMPPSPEEQRISDLYRLKGIDALVKELARF